MLNTFTDLVLLVGTNPLPNYVVAKYFLKNNEQLQRIWLICSGGTQKHEETLDLACNIREVIQKEFGFKAIEEVPLSDVGSASQIRRDLSQNFSKRASDNGIFHLNYTGGTKSMAVHTYRFFEDSEWKCSFSYLDGRDYRLKYDDELQGISGDLRCEIGLSLEDLIALHGYEKKTEEKFYNKETVKKFEELIEHDKLEEYIKWKKSKNGETSNYISELLKTIPNKQFILDNNDASSIPDNSLSYSNISKKLESEIKEFLDGKWLEAYVYDVITRSVKNDRELKEIYKKGQIVIGINWKIKKKNSADKDFELDVILLNGYQVCGISCTTSSKDKVCKNRGFEVIHRVRQIGGEEARAVLVTCLKQEKIENFYEDLKDQTGSRSHEFLVLGLQDLKPNRLWDKIRKHIWGEI